MWHGSPVTLSDVVAQRSARAIHVFFPHLSIGTKMAEPRQWWCQGPFRLHIPVQLSLNVNRWLNCRWNHTNAVKDKEADIYLPIQNTVVYPPPPQSAFLLHLLSPPLWGCSGYCYSLKKLPPEKQTIRKRLDSGICIWLILVMTIDSKKMTLPGVP